MHRRRCGAIELEEARGKLGVGNDVQTDQQHYPSRALAQLYHHWRETWWEMVVVRRMRREMDFAIPVLEEQIEEKGKERQLGCETDCWMTS